MTMTCAHPSSHSLLPQPCCRALCAYFTPTYSNPAPDAPHASVCHLSIPARLNHLSSIHTSQSASFPCTLLPVLYARIFQRQLAPATPWRGILQTTNLPFAAYRLFSCRPLIIPGSMQGRTTDGPLALCVPAQSMHPCPSCSHVHPVTTPPSATPIPCLPSQCSFFLCLQWYAIVFQPAHRVADLYAKRSRLLLRPTVTACSTCSLAAIGKVHASNSCKPS